MWIFFPLGFSKASEALKRAACHYEHGDYLEETECSVWHSHKRTERHWHATAESEEREWNSHNMVLVSFPTPEEKC